MKNKKSVRVRGVKGYGPRHMMNAQEGSEAVPSELPSPPEWVEAQRRRVTRDGGMANLTPGILGGLGEAGSQLAGMSKEDVAKLAISMLAGGEGEMPVPGKAVAPKLAHTQAVKVTWPDGLVHYDEIGGADQADALRRAQENWDGAKIEPVGEVPLKYGLGNSRYEGLGALTPEDAADAAKLNDLKTKHSLGQFPYKGPSDYSDRLPPEEFKRGKVAVAKGFGPAHAENSKEGEDLTKVNTDTVPAMLTPREAVLNRNAAELAGRGTIEKLNEDGNELAKKGVDLAARGQASVPVAPVAASSRPVGSSDVLKYLRSAALAQVARSQVPKLAVQKGSTNVKMKPKQKNAIYNRVGSVPQGAPPAPPSMPPPVQSASFYPPGQSRFAPPQAAGFAGGTSQVNPEGIGAPAPGANFPQVQLSAPNIMSLLQHGQQNGLSAGQVQGLMKAVQGFGQGYNQLTGGPGSASDMATAPTGAGYQGGISDIGYPPMLMPDATYHADKGSSWVGPYDPAYLVQRYARGTSEVPFR